jgi:hypothetical protein
MLFLPILFLVLGIAYGKFVTFRFQFQNKTPGSNAIIDSIVLYRKAEPRRPVVHFRSGQDNHVDVEILSLEDIKEIKLNILGGETVPAEIPKLSNSQLVVRGTKYVLVTLKYQANVTNSCDGH